MMSMVIIFLSLFVIFFMSIDLYCMLKKQNFTLMNLISYSAASAVIATFFIATVMVLL